MFASPSMSCPAKAGHPALDRRLSRAMTTLLASASLIPRHLLKHGANCCGVLPAEALLHRLAIDRLGRGEDRRPDTNFPGEVADHVHVLLPDIDLHGDVV